MFTFICRSFSHDTFIPEVKCAQTHTAEHFYFKIKHFLKDYTFYSEFSSYTALK